MKNEEKSFDAIEWEFKKTRVTVVAVLVFVLMVSYFFGG